MENFGLSPRSFSSVLKTRGTEEKILGYWWKKAASELKVFPKFPIDFLAEPKGKK